MEQNFYNFKAKRLSWEKLVTFLVKPISIHITEVYTLLAGVDVKCIKVYISVHQKRIYEKISL